MLYNSNKPSSWQAARNASLRVYEFEKALLLKQLFLSNLNTLKTFLQNLSSFKALSITKFKNFLNNFFY